MNKKKISAWKVSTIIAFGFLSVLGLSASLLPEESPFSAETAVAKKPSKKAKAKKPGKGGKSSPKKPSPAGTGISKCGDVDTAFDYGCRGADSKSGKDTTNPIFLVMFFILNLLAVGVGVTAVGGVVYGAILYTSAGDSSEQTKKGISVVVNAVLGVVLFAFMYAVLNFLVPGGLFS